MSSDLLPLQVIRRERFGKTVIRGGSELKLVSVCLLLPFTCQPLWVCTESQARGRGQSMVAGCMPTAQTYWFEDPAHWNDWGC